MHPGRGAGPPPGRAPQRRSSFAYLPPLRLPALPLCGDAASVPTPGLGHAWIRRSWRPWASRSRPGWPTTASDGVWANMWVRRSEVGLPRTIGVRLAAALCCLSFVLVAGCTSDPSSVAAPLSNPPSPTASPLESHTPKHPGIAGDAPIVVIFMENHEQSEVVGSSSAPYQNSLIREGRSYTNYFAITHPSLPNYLAFASGSTHGKTDDDIAVGEIDGPTLWTQLTAAGIRWAVYEESMPSPCFTQGSSGSSPGDYALKHNPAMPFRAVASDAAECGRVQPLTQMDPKQLPPMSFITPNECNDAHSCDLSSGDAWLAGHVPALLGAGADVIVTYDEGTTDVGADGGSGGGQVFAVEAGPGVPNGATVPKPLNHYSLLAGIEQRFRLAKLGEASGATPLPI